MLTRPSILVSTLLSYEYERDDYYCYPDSPVLRSELGIKDEKELAEAEREKVIFSANIFTRFAKVMAGFSVSSLENLHQEPVI